MHKIDKVTIAPINSIHMHPSINFTTTKKEVNFFSKGLTYLANKQYSFDWKSFISE